MTADETAAEHVRNALQLLGRHAVAKLGGVEAADQDVSLSFADFSAAWERLLLAVELLERKASNG